MRLAALQQDLCCCNTRCALRVGFAIPIFPL